MTPLLLGISLLAGTFTSGCNVTLSAGQQEHVASVSGQITDPTGVALGHAQVLLKKASGERVYQSADDKGCYSFVASPGDYKLSARAHAFRSRSINLHLTEGKTEIGNLALDLGGCTSCVRVEGAGTLSLQVKDRRGVPMPSSTVTLQVSGEPHQISVQLDDWGGGWVQPPAGKYILRVKAPGFSSVERIVLIKEGQDSVQEVDLTNGGSGTRRQPANCETPPKSLFTAIRAFRTVRRGRNCR